MKKWKNNPIRLLFVSYSPIFIPKTRYLPSRLANSHHPQPAADTGTPELNIESETWEVYTNPLKAGFEPSQDYSLCWSPKDHVRDLIGVGDALDLTVLKTVKWVGKTSCSWITKPFIRLHCFRHFAKSVFYFGNSSFGSDEVGDLPIVLGSIVISGPLPAAQECVAGVACEISYTGTHLDEIHGGRVILLPIDHVCGEKPSASITPPEVLPLTEVYSTAARTGTRSTAPSTTTPPTATSVVRMFVFWEYHFACREKKQLSGRVV